MADFRTKSATARLSVRHFLVTNVADRTIRTTDNLDSLRGRNSASDDLTFLDPPFDFNHTYAVAVCTAVASGFKDTRTLSDLGVAWMGLITDEPRARYLALQNARGTHG